MSFNTTPCNESVIRVEYLPKGSSDYNAVEECWRQGKEDLLVSRYYLKFFDLKSAIANYYRTGINEFIQHIKGWYKEDGQPHILK